jgi:hypothetical protein
MLSVITQTIVVVKELCVPTCACSFGSRWRRFKEQRLKDRACCSMFEVQLHLELEDELIQRGLFCLTQ